MTSTAMIAAPSPWAVARSGEKSMATVSDTTGDVGVGAPRRGREGVRVQSATVDLDPQELLEAHVGEPHLRTEVLEQGELARLGGRLEDDVAEPERVDEALRERRLELPAVVEEPDVLRALTALDHEPACAEAEPPTALLHELVHPALVERAVVLLAELELQAQAALRHHLRHLLGLEGQLGEALAALDT